MLNETLMDKYLDQLLIPRHIDACCRIISKAEAEQGPLNAYDRAELLKTETGFYSDEIYALVERIEADGDKPAVTSESHTISKAA